MTEVADGVAAGPATDVAAAEPATGAGAPAIAGAGIRTAPG